MRADLPIGRDDASKQSEWDRLPSMPGHRHCPRSNLPAKPGDVRLRLICEASSALGDGEQVGLT